MIKRMLIIAFIICCEFIFSVKLHKKFGVRPKVIASFATGLGFLVGQGALLDTNIHKSCSCPQCFPSSYVAPAVADSTGKLSTKLTAKRRYLPRIILGIEKFNALSLSDKIKVDAFINEDLPGFGRAMNLYGASLRKVSLHS